MRILGKDDFEFANALSRAGYQDLASIVLNTIEGTNGGSGGDPLSASALRFDFDKAEAYRETDTVTRVEKLGKLVESMESFVQQHPGTPAAEGVSDALLDLYRSIGEQIAVALQDPANVDSATKLRELGTAMFERGIGILEKEMASLTTKREEHAAANPDTPNEDLDRQYMLVSYSLARTQYFFALLYEKFAKEVRLKQALATLADIQLEFPDQLLCFETYIYEGLCRSEMEQPEEAIVAFDYAIKLRELYEAGPGGTYQVAPEAADIISSGVLQKMLIQSKAGDHAAAIETARDFYATIPDGMQALKGLAILAQQAEEYRALPDQKLFEETARKLIDLDPRGPAGQRGRELLGGGGGGASSSLSAVDTLRLAESAAGQGDTPRAIELCQDVMISAHGVPTEQDLGSQAGLLLGALFARDNQLHEAAVAWESSAERYSKGKEAPECLWRAVNCYITLGGQEKLDLYKTRAREGMNALVSRYPDHPRASGAALIEGQRLEAEQDFVGAAKVFESVQPGTAVYEDALYRAGKAWSSQARKLLQQKQSAQEAVTKSESLLRKATNDLEAAAGQTLDTNRQDYLKGLAFNARLTLAGLYLVKGVDRPADVAAALEGAENLFPGDKPRLSSVRILRIRALLDQDKVDPAMSLLDQQVTDDPSAKGIGACAGDVAQKLDAQATALRETDRDRADRMSRRASDYYLLAIRRQASGDGNMKPEELEAIANRLFSFALAFNGVPDDVNTFVGWKGARTSADLLETSARTYEEIMPLLTNTTKAQINLGRAFGFLGQWTQAAARYSELFAKERLADLTAKTLNPDLLRRKPELITAFLEWGVCLREVGNAKFDKQSLEQANAVFEILVLNTEEEGKLWWLSKYYQLQTMSDRGEYEVAKIAMRSLETNWPEFDEDKYGLKEKLKALRDELAKKVIEIPKPR